MKWSKIYNKHASIHSAPSLDHVVLDLKGSWSWWFVLERIFDACACVWSLRTPARTVCRVLRKCGMNRKMPFMDAYYAHAYTHLSSFFLNQMYGLVVWVPSWFLWLATFSVIFLGNKHLANKKTSRQITWPMVFGETTIGQEMIWPPSTTLDVASASELKSMAPRAVTAEAFFFRWRTNSVSPRMFF